MKEDYIPVPDMSDRFPSVDLPAFPEIIHIDASRLRIDKRYQRSIEKTGALLVREMVKGFDWTVFGVVVAPIERDLFAIVDGQHRTAALIGMGHAKIPCVITNDRGALAQARKFIKINTSRTAMTTHQVFKAKLSAQDKDAMALEALVARAGGQLSAYQFGVNTPKNIIGHTNAVGCLEKLYKRDCAVLERVYRVIVQAEIMRVSPYLLNGLFNAVTDRIYAPHCTDNILIDVFKKYKLTELKVEVARHCDYSGDKVGQAWPLIIWQKCMELKETVGEQS